jgi:methionyl aminopeptidase
MIVLRSKQEIEKLRHCGEITAEILEALELILKPGLTTLDLERAALGVIQKRGARSAFKGYHGFPGNICVSINEEIVHGIPGPKKLRDGDIVGIDVGVVKNGYYGDMARTYPVGTVDEEKIRLLNVSREALAKGVAQAFAGNWLHDISHAIEKHAVGAGYSVVKAFVGHGIGTRMHEDPQVPNFGKPRTGPRLRPGMVLAIEPMVNMGTGEVVVLSDGWTAVTKDGRVSAHFEDTIAVTESGPEVLTCLKKNR